MMTLSMPVPMRGGEQVLCGGDEDGPAHEAGGVADAGDVAAVGGDLEVFKVGAAEDDAGAGGRGDEPEMDGRAAVQADAGEGDLRADGLLIMACWSQVFGSLKVDGIRGGGEAAVAD